MKKITVIIPAYNEEESLGKLYQRLSGVLNKIENYEFEMLFINDGSKDKTKEILRQLREIDSRVSYVFQEILEKKQQ